MSTKFVSLNGVLSNIFDAQYVLKYCSFTGNVVNGKIQFRNPKSPFFHLLLFHFLSPLSFSAK